MKTLPLWKYVLFVSVFVKMPSSSVTLASASETTIPSSFDAPFGSYPNILNITPEEREIFSPVVFFPEMITGRFHSSNNKAKIDNITIKDHRESNEELASKDAIERRRKRRKKPFQKLLSLQPKDPDNRPWQECWGIGKYDENRDGGMYASDLFDDVENTIDGYGGQRTIHLGIDLGGPLGTSVHAFCDGIVHSVGYNPELGDYGHVVVVEHFWGDGKKCWALYGHLDSSALSSNKGWKKFLPRKNLLPGDAIRKGQVLGRMGDIDENGGWIHTHLHFQLSTKPPDQPHDMPGASSVQDRVDALQQYPDPRYVLGPMY